jgi:hypothetical protein
MITGEVGGEFGLSDVDDLPPCRPALVQPRINADDLPDRALRAVPAGPFGEAHPEERGEVMLSAVLAVSDAATFAACRIAVDRQPPAAGLLFATAIWVCRSVAGAGVAVGERAATNPVTLTRRLPYPRIQRLILKEAERAAPQAWALDLRGDRQVRIAHNVDTDFTGGTSGRTPGPRRRAGRDHRASADASSGHPSDLVPPAAGTIPPPPGREAGHVPPLAGRYGGEA